jgi:hypothetical protein
MENIVGTPKNGIDFFLSRFWEWFLLDGRLERDSLSLFMVV